MEDKATVTCHNKRIWYKKPARLRRCINPDRGTLLKHLQQTRWRNDKNVETVRGNYDTALSMSATTHFKVKVASAKPSSVDISETIIRISEK